MLTTKCSVDGCEATVLSLKKCFFTCQEHSTKLSHFQTCSFDPGLRDATSSKNFESGHMRDVQTVSLNTGESTAFRKDWKSRTNKIRPRVLEELKSYDVEKAKQILKIFNSTLGDE